MHQEEETVDYHVPPSSQVQGHSISKEISKGYHFDGNWRGVRERASSYAKKRVIFAYPYQFGSRELLVPLV